MSEWLLWYLAACTLLVTGTAAFFAARAARFRHSKGDSRLAKLIVDSSDRAILAIDTAGRIIQINPVGEVVFGISRSAALGRQFEEVFSDIHANYWFVLHTLRRGVNYRNHRVEYWPFGSGKGHFLVDTARLFDEEGRLVGVMVCAKDYSDDYPLKSDIIARERLEAAGQVAAAAAHEIRNPLTAVKGFLQLIDRDLEGEQKEFIRIGLRELKRVEDLIKEFLLLAKPAGIEMIDINLGELIEQVTALTWQEARELNIKVIVNCSCRANVKGDPLKLGQVFFNLYRNAFEAMPQGGRLEVSVRHLAWEWTCIEVSDSGPGIADGLSERIFDPLFSTKNPGPGLGLAICRRVIEDHGGRVTASNQIGGGARFVILLPSQRSRTLSRETEIDPREKQRDETVWSGARNEEMGLN